MEEKEGKLGHLHLGEVLLPPEVLLDLRPEGGKEVVEVHDGVDAHVEEAAEGCVASSDKPEHEKSMIQSPRFSMLTKASSLVVCSGLLLS